MIAYLHGKVLHHLGASIILEVGGVGYQVYLASRQQPAIGQDYEVYCSHQVREDSATLYGFTTPLERTWFELLLSVSGVGPKSALAIVASSQPARLEQAIIAGQTALFEAVSGIGKKVAAKIIVELKGKVGGLGTLLPTETGQDSSLIEALESLGYRRAEMLPILADLPASETSLEAQIRWVLKRVKTVK